jgi:hypothetical protein
MDRRLPILALLFLALLVPSTAQEQTSRPRPEAKARNFLANRYYKCGEDYFTKWVSHDEGFTPADPDRDTVYQYKGLRWHLDPQPVTDAEKLNGTFWHGNIIVEYDAFRTHRKSGDGFYHGNFYHGPRWLGWQDGKDQRDLFWEELKGDKWTIDDMRSILDSDGWEAISCDEVDKLLKDPDANQISYRPL